MIAAPAGSGAGPSPPGAKSTTFTPDVVGDFTLRLTVHDGGGLTDSCETVVKSRIGPPTAICPDDMTLPTRTEVLLHGDAVDDGYIVAWEWEAVSHDTDTDPELGSPFAQDTTFEARRVGTYVMRLTVEDDHGLATFCQFTITTTPTGPDAICPADIETIPLVPIGWTGSGEDDGEIVSASWSMLSAPSGSAAAPPAPGSGFTVTFTPDIVGEYRMELTVWDDDGNQGTCEFSVLATPGEGLRVELVWNPPESPMDHSDVDLHLLHQNGPAWFHETYDCYYTNCDSAYGYNLDWDVPNDLSDNPRLDLDDTDGFGPENINIDDPVPGHSYRVGVHYYDDHGGGVARVHVKIYCGMISLNPVYEVGPIDLTGYSGDPYSNDFLKVADVTWDGFNCAVAPLSQIVTAEQASNSP